MIVQEYELDKYPEYHSRIFSRALRGYVPSQSKQLEHLFNESAFELNPVRYGIELLMPTLQDMTEEHFNVPEELRSSHEIKKEEWDFNHPSFRSGIKWFEGMTQLQASIDADQFDRNQLNQYIVGNIDPWTPANLGAMAVGQLFDPLTYVPFLGVGSKVASMGAKVFNRINLVKNVSQVEKLSALSYVGKAGKAVAKPFKPVGYWAAEAGLAETTYQFIKHASLSGRGRDVDYIAAMQDISIATLTGGILGTMPMAIKLKKQFSQTEIADYLGKTAGDLKNWGYSKFNGQGSKSEPKLSKKEAEAKYNEKMESMKEPEKEVNYISDMEGYFKTLGDDINTGLPKIISTFQKCFK